MVQVLYYDGQQAIRSRYAKTQLDFCLQEQQTHLARKHVDESACNSLHYCRQATAIESPWQSALLVFIIPSLDSSLLALLSPLGRLGLLLLRGLSDLLVIVVLDLSGSSSLLALLLLGSLGSFLLRSLRDFLVVVVASTVVLVVVLGLSSSSLALLGSSAVRALRIYATEREI